MEDIEKHYQKLAEQDQHNAQFEQNGIEFWSRINKESQQAFWDHEAEQKEQNDRAFIHQHVSEQNESAHQQAVANAKKVSQEVAQIAEQSSQQSQASSQGNQDNNSQSVSNNSDEKQEQQKKMSAREKMKQQSEEMSNQKPTMTLSFSHS